MRGRRSQLLAAAFAATLAFCAATTASAQTTLPSYVQPYGTDDAGGFYNVLPPGEAGVDNATQFLQYEALGTLPPNFDDQQSLYENLLYAAPTLTPSEIPDYYKDATFGVKPQDITRVENPAPGVTIVRDQYDVPHIYGETRADVMFGAGFAGAEDRLFLMDVLRHTAEASLSSFVGGSAGDQAMDEQQWTVAPYTQADLQQQINNAGKLYGAAGLQVVGDVNNYVDGVNAYIRDATLGLEPMPFEYTAIEKSPQPWTATDVVATASLIGAIFGKGGGNQVQGALTEEAFVKRFGQSKGRVAWENFREANDPAAPTTVSKPFPYETDSPFAKRGLAMPDPGSVKYVSPGATNPDSAETSRSAPSLAAALEGGASSRASGGSTLGYTDAPDPIAIPSDGSIGSMLLKDFYGQPALASNWELVNARHSTDGHSVAVMGPQVGYYIPQILMEEDLHGPGIDARGAAFPGVNMYVELGHGTDYAWSATTATSANVFTFAEVLCNPNGGAVSANSTYYTYKGRCLSMQKLVRTNSWTPNLDDSTPAGSATLTTYRTVHGLVFARGTVHGKPVAFVTARTSYMHEADSAVGFSELNEPNFVTGPKQFQKAASAINFGFNWAYVNANHIAYFESGWYPDRSRDTSPDFPIFGTGQYDFKNWNPSLWTETDIPFSAHPQAIDPTYLVSWNNKQAPKWSAADDNYGYGDIYRSQLIADHITGDLRHGKVNAAQLVQAMDLAATEDIRIVKLWPLLRRVLGNPSNPRLRTAIAELNQWYDAGGHRWDLDRSGTYANNAAIETMDAWWPKLLTTEFEPRLEPTVFSDLQGMLGFGAVDAGQAPNEPDFAQGWYGYVSKDLLDLFAARQNASLRASARRHHKRHVKLVKVPGGYSMVYCGDGSFARCESELRSSLLAALSVTPKQLYGYGACASNPQPSCFDQDEWTDASAISLPPFPFQNRPTFQQVVELTRTLPR